MPERIWLIRAARYLNVAPWDLEEQSPDWQEWALTMEDAEAWAENERVAHADAGRRNKR